MRNSIETAREHIESHDVISFDVFDTLIFRAVAKPSSVFALVKLRLLTGEAALYHPDVVDAFPELRIQAEVEARRDKRGDDEHGEVTFDEIYDKLAQLSGADAALVRLLKQTELEYEHRLVYRNPEAGAMFDFALELGKRIVLCSDMYLPADVVRSLLLRCGYDGYDALYVSCEHARNKHLGTMFAYVCANSNVAPERVLHIGDNEHSDAVMARSAGWTAIHLPHANGVRKVRTPWKGERPFYPATVAAIVDGIRRKRSLERGAASADPWEELGFNVFGPLFTGFLLWLRAAIERQPPDRVLLFARDTHFVATHLPSFLTGLDPAPPVHYLHVSRASTLLPSFTDFPLHRLDHLCSGRTQRTVAQHLRKLGLEPSVLAAVAASAGFASLDERVRNGDDRMRDLLGRVQHLVLREAALRRPIAQAYLEGFVEDARDVMVVDVGWVGNMQASFLRLLQSTHPNVRVRGYYAGLFASSSKNAWPGHSMQAWLMRPGDPLQIEEQMWWAGGVEILEFAMTAPHGTALGYQRNAVGGVDPILEETTVEREVHACAMRLQAGASQFAQTFRALFGDLPAQGLTSRAWASEFYRLVTDPSEQEAELLGDITHSDSVGETSLRLPLAPKVENITDAFKAIRSAFWKTGFVVRNGLQNSDCFDEDLYLALYPDIRRAFEAGQLPSGLFHWTVAGKDEGRIGSWADWMRRNGSVVPAHD